MCTKQVIQYSCGCVKEIIHHYDRDPHKLFNYPRERSSKPCYRHFWFESLYKRQPQSSSGQNPATGHKSISSRGNKHIWRDVSDSRTSGNDDIMEQFHFGETTEKSIIRELQRDYRPASEADNLINDSDSMSKERENDSDADDYPYDDYPYCTSFTRKSQVKDWERLRPDARNIPLKGQRGKDYDRRVETDFRDGEEDEVLSGETLIPDQHKDSSKRS
jgi:hypothetical protein